MIVSQSGYKKALEESERDVFGNKTWGTAYSELDYQTQLAEAQAARTFGAEVAQAYEAATIQKANIAGSNLTEGYKTLLNDELSDSMSQAYNQYLANYESNLSSISQSSTSAKTTIDEQLAERAEYLEAFNTSHYDYLQYLDEWISENATDDERNEFYKTMNFGKFYNTEDITDTDGNITQNYTLKSWEELSIPVLDPLTGEYISLYDNSGNLTRAGRNYYKQIENYYGQYATAAGSNIPSFAAYLYEANPELYDYINTTNLYSYTETGTGANENLGAFRKALGIESDADTYRFLDEFGGLSKSQIDEVFYDIQTKFDSIDIENISTADFNNVINEFAGLAQTIGYLPEGQSVEDFKSQANALLMQYQQYASAQGSAESGAVGSVIVTGLSIAALLALTVASGGAAAPLLGATAATSLGSALTALSVGGATGVAAMNEADAAAAYEKLANASERELKTLFNDVLVGMTASVQEQYEQKLIDGGGKLAQGANLTIGSSFETLDEWAKASDTPLTENEYQSFYNQVSTKSNYVSADSYFVQGLGSGRTNDDIDITIGSNSRNKDAEFDLKCGAEVTNSRMTSYLNKYSTGDFKTTPTNGALVVVASKMYIYTKKGWRVVESDHSDVADAISAYLKQ